jgi:hypothetical protein
MGYTKGKGEGPDENEAVLASLLRSRQLSLTLDRGLAVRLTSKGHIMVTILVIILIVLLLGGGGYGYRSGNNVLAGGGGLIGLILIIVLILLLLGHI